MVDSPEIAAEIVRAMNAFEGLKDAARKGREHSPDLSRGGYPAAVSTGRLPTVPAGPAPGARESGRERSPNPYADLPAFPKAVVERLTGIDTDTYEAP